MTKIEIQFRIRQCQAEISRCQSRRRTNARAIEEIELTMKNLSRRHDSFMEERHRLLAYASEAEPGDYSNTSIEREYTEGIQEMLKGDRFAHAVYAFRNAIAKLSEDRQKLMRECNDLSRRITEKTRELEHLRQLLEQA